MNRPKPIKPFNTLEEEAYFWDTHDVSELINNPKSPLSSLSKIEKEKEASITIRVQKSVKDNLSELARQKGVNPSTLSRMWIIEKMRDHMHPSAV